VLRCSVARTLTRPSDRRVVAPLDKNEFKNTDVTVVSYADSYMYFTGWTIAILGFDSRRGLGIFLFTAPSRTALGPTQAPIQRIPGALSLWVKRPGREADHSPPCSAELKNAWSYTSTPPYVSTAWCLIKQWVRFYGVVHS
jgi:hypothetical protein